MDVSYILDGLNDAQRQAVTSESKKLLVLAGAGSGKTKVLTSRVANIVEKNLAFPNEILAVTFTNKAAREMQNRISLILKKRAVGLPWLGTFHSICAKILRKHAKAVNLTQNFTIIDQDDQQRLILFCISLAALLVKVTASISFGNAKFFSTIFAILDVRTFVLPEPAPATINSGPDVCKTASF